MLLLLAKAQSNKGMAYIRAVWGNELWNTLVSDSPSSQQHTDVFQKQTLSKLPLSTRNKINNTKNAQCPGKDISRWSEYPWLWEQIKLIQKGSEPFIKIEREKNTLYNNTEWCLILSKTKHKLVFFLLSLLQSVKLPRASNSISPWLPCRTKANTLSTVYQKQSMMPQGTVSLNLRCCQQRKCWFEIWNPEFRENSIWARSIMTRGCSGLLCVHLEQWWACSDIMLGSLKQMSKNQNVNWSNS